MITYEQVAIALKIIEILPSHDPLHMEAKDLLSNYLKH